MDIVQYITSSIDTSLEGYAPSSILIAYNLTILFWKMFSVYRFEQEFAKEYLKKAKEEK